jgi:phospholipid/cholesterol/gamma-HCH transport system permease protein
LSAVVEPSGGAGAIARPERGRVGSFFAEAGELVTFSLRVLGNLPGTLRYFSEVLRQASIIIRGTTVLMLYLNICLGISVVTFAFFLLRTLGASEFVGLFSGYITPRQVAPTMFGYVIAAKVCTGMSAELGAMRIQQEVDALETTGVEPLQYLVGTRVLGFLIFVPIACAVALIGQWIGDYIDGVVVLHGVPAATLTRLQWSVQGIGDQLYALVSMLMIALPCAIVACFYGLRAKGGPASVGSVAARAVMINLIIVHVVSGLLGVAYYGSNLRLPIGG